MRVGEGEGRNLIEIRSVRVYIPRRSRRASTSHRDNDVCISCCNVDVS